MHNLLFNRHENEIAFFYRGKTYSTKQIYSIAAQLAKKIANPGLRCLIPTNNPIHFLASLIACVRVGCTAIPAPITDPETQLPSHAHYQPDAIIAFEINDHSRLIWLNSNHQQTQPHLGDVILTTTGSTGKPKGVVLNLNQLLLNAYLAGHCLGLNANLDWVIETDLNFTSGLCHVLMAWVCRSTLYYLKGATVEQKRKIFSMQQCGYGGSPIQALRLIDELNEVCVPQHLMTSGDFLTEGMIKKIQHKFPTTQIHKCYGLTELSGRFCFMPAQALHHSPDAVGYPMPGFTYQIQNEYGEQCLPHEVGEIYVSSPMLMQGYFKEGEFFPTKRGQWFATHDLGAVDKNNALCLQGRSNDSFKVGGEKVDRFTIEKALSSILTDFEYCVLPAPHDYLGFIPILYVAQNNSRSLPSWKSIITNLKERLDPKFIPMQGKIVSSLPRLENGKLDRQQVACCVAQEWAW